MSISSVDQGLFHLILQSNKCIGMAVDISNEVVIIVHSMNIIILQTFWKSYAFIRLIAINFRTDYRPPYTAHCSRNYLQKNPHPSTSHTSSSSLSHSLTHCFDLRIAKINLPASNNRAMVSFLARGRYPSFSRWEV